MTRTLNKTLYCHCVWSIHYASTISTSKNLYFTHTQKERSVVKSIDRYIWLLLLYQELCQAGKATVKSIQEWALEWNWPERAGKSFVTVFNMDLGGINTVNSVKKEKKARRSAHKDLWREDLKCSDWSEDSKKEGGAQRHSRVLQMAAHGKIIFGWEIAELLYSGKVIIRFAFLKGPCLSFGGMN